MQMRIIGNVWLSGRAYGCGEVLDLPEPEAERLAVLGVAEPASAELQRPAPEPVEMPETAEPVDPRPVSEPAKPKRKRGKR